ncbi:hypothetical protein OH76DRAFT_1419637 [Lentinus brumalis]|uniref:Uncharacterized protein n=1 Tax=Lentinus brumalis TaxID=2498619 RepID=A0A371D4D7_9APHY|nr:hypothetical protein OH76DRAFT_1419637 [Polyporus brumalis]
MTSNQCKPGTPTLPKHMSGCNTSASGKGNCLTVPPPDLPTFMTPNLPGVHGPQCTTDRRLHADGWQTPCLAACPSAVRRLLHYMPPAARMLLSVYPPAPDGRLTASLSWRLGVRPHWRTSAPYRLDVRGTGVTGLHGARRTYAAGRQCACATVVAAAHGGLNTWVSFIRESLNYAAPVTHGQLPVNTAAARNPLADVRSLPTRRPRYRRHWATRRPPHIRRWPTMRMRHGRSRCTPHPYRLDVCRADIAGTQNTRSTYAAGRRCAIITHTDSWRTLAAYMSGPQRQQDPLCYLITDLPGNMCHGMHEPRP